MDPKQQEALHIQPCDEFSSKTEEIIRPSVPISVSVFEKIIHIIDAADHFGDDIKLPRKAISANTLYINEYACGDLSNWWGTRKAKCC